MLPETRVYFWRWATLKPLARSLRHRLMNIEATGIYGDDHGFRSLWDEFCFEAQEGEIEALSDAWTDALFGPCEEIFQILPQHIAELLSWSLWAESHDEQDNYEAQFVDKGSIIDAIIEAAGALAIDRDLTVLADKRVRPWPKNSPLRHAAVDDLPLFNVRTQPEWSVSVDRADVIEALKLVRTRVTLKRKGNEWERDVVLAGSDGILSIRSSHAAYDLPARGTWSSPILTSGAAFLKLAPKLEGSIIQISFASGVLTIGTTQYTAREL